MADAADVFLAKAQRSLAGAESEFRHDRYDNCANRCYYACFQAAIYALLREGIQPGSAQWSHAFVQAQFAGQLINRRKIYPATLRDVLPRAFELRRIADYGVESVTHLRAGRALKATRELLAAVQDRGS